MLSIEFNMYSTVWSEYLSTQKSTLPSLPDFSKLSNRVARIIGGNPGHMQLQGTNTYILGTGASRILIDTGQGIPLWATNIIRYLDDHNLEISHVLLTHCHVDHTGGVADLLRCKPQLKQCIYKNNPDQGQQKIKDGQVFNVEGATVKCLFTPGHALDHMCFLLEEENALFTGDNVLGHGYSIADDLGVYTQSLERMQNQGCLVGYPGHGAKIDDLPRRIAQYIRHRKSRERQVYSALMTCRTHTQRNKDSKMQSLTVRELVESLHGRISNDVFEMAFEPLVTQVLWKLAEERKLGFRMVGRNKEWFAHEAIPAK